MMEAEVGRADAPGCDGCREEEDMVEAPRGGLVVESYPLACPWKVVGSVAAARLNRSSSPWEEVLVVAARSLGEDDDNHVRVPS